MPNVSSLVHEGGVLIMSLRHGPIPRGRRMFDVLAEETTQLPSLLGLQPVLTIRTSSIQQVNRNIGVTWTRLTLAKGREKN
jgi:hypothetical protein